MKRKKNYKATPGQFADLLYN